MSARRTILVVAGLCLALVAQAPAFNMAFVTVGDAGNAGELSGLSAGGYGAWGPDRPNTGAASDLYLTAGSRHQQVTPTLDWPYYGFRVATLLPPAALGDFDGDGDVDVDDINDLCANMGGDPATYDLDGDLDVDEDDLTFLIETLVEWDNGVDTGVGTKRGDFNLDGVVNATDLAIMKGTFGTSGVGYADGNANCDTVVNATDLAILKGTFGFIAPTGGGVPEPMTIGLLAVGACLPLFRRKRR